MVKYVHPYDLYSNTVLFSSMGIGVLIGVPILLFLAIDVPEYLFAFSESIHLGDRTIDDYILIYREFECLPSDLQDIILRRPLKLSEIRYVDVVNDHVSYLNISTIIVKFLSFKRDLIISGVLWPH